MAQPLALLLLLSGVASIGRHGTRFMSGYGMFLFIYDNAYYVLPNCELPLNVYIHTHKCLVTIEEKAAQNLEQSCR